MTDTRNAAKRFWAKVNKTSSCWNWTGTSTIQGYGQFWVGPKRYMAYRWLWAQEYGAIRDDLQIDHLCRNPRCVRLDHLELVSLRTNILRGVSRSAQNARKTHCKRGHLLSGENVHISVGHRGHGRRRCKACSRKLSRRLYRKHKELLNQEPDHG